ncbi:hypothetical protein CFP56_032489 [Quercus suber]|uniref:Uncharacterized protein n=1 Tax=Quercus suber TaxID=58331 RepID=A0AAW0JI61_QUESU
MEEVQDIVIVGAGIAGLTTSLGLQKYPSSLSIFRLFLYFHTQFVKTFTFSKWRDPNALKYDIFGGKALIGCDGVNSMEAK